MNYGRDEIADEFHKFKNRLANWHDDGWAPGHPWRVALFERIESVFRSWQPNADSNENEMDLVSIVAHAIRMAIANEVDDGLSFVVPRTGWPSDEAWRRAGIRAIPVGDTFQLVAETLSLDWMNEDDVARVFGPAFEAKVCREVSDQSLPIDPYIRRNTPLPHKTYTSAAQREAVRAAFQCEAGRTLVVNMPTGLGKSMVGYAPALASEANKLTVVVVPTVALALDQERALNELCPREFQSTAYHGDLSDQVRKTIKDRIRDGRQRVVFASPESIVGSLSLALAQAARGGKLGYFVVDEAHIVAQWGEEFRPEFQSMAGLRSELLRYCPREKFRTILLSATLTPESYEVLRYLFGTDGELDHVSAPAIRPEPIPWLVRAANEEQRKEMLLQAIDRSPRPAIVYVSKVADAKRWMRELKKVGFQRIDAVHGDVSDKVRKSILEQWAARDLDVIVATSAFGLGIDQSDVRTVIHACIPETIDRYYQEIGRGGRDGRASMGLLIATKADEKVAHNLSENRRIGAQKGFRRWERMWDCKEPLGEDRYVLDLSLVPHDVDADSGANQAWNLRTLSLLAKAKVLRFDGRPPPDFFDEGNGEPAMSEAERKAKVDQYFQQCVVKMVERDAPHNTLEFWEGRMEEVRQHARHADEQGLEHIMSLTQQATTGSQQAYWACLHAAYEIPGVAPVARNGIAINKVRPKMSVLYKPVPQNFLDRTPQYRFFARSDQWESILRVELSGLGPVHEIICSSFTRQAFEGRRWRNHRVFDRQFCQINQLGSSVKRTGGVVVAVVHPNDDLPTAMGHVSALLHRRQHSALIFFLPKNAPDPFIPGRLAFGGGPYGSRLVG